MLNWSSLTVNAPVPSSIRLAILACVSALVTACLSASVSPVNSVFCVGVEKVIQASAAAPISATSIAIGRLRRTAGCASTLLICNSGLANFSGRAEGEVVARAVLIDYTGMLMMSLYADSNLLRTCSVASNPTEACWRASMTLAMSTVSPRS